MASTTSNQDTDLERGLESLRPEILQLVAAKLRRQDVMSLYTSCSSMRKAVASTVYERLQLALPITKFNSGLLLAANKVQKLKLTSTAPLRHDINGTTEAFLQLAYALILQLDGLKELDLQTLRLKPEAVGVLRQVCPQLQSLRLQLHAMALPAGLASLTSLHLDCYMPISDDLIKAVATHLGSLEVLGLTLRPHDRVPGSLHVNYLVQLKGLRQLRLAMTPGAADSYTVALGGIGNMPKLQDIELHEVRITAAGLEHLRQATQLTRLDFRSERGLPNGVADPELSMMTLPAPPSSAASSPGSRSNHGGPARPPLIPAGLAKKFCSIFNFVIAGHRGLTTLSLPATLTVLSLELLSVACPNLTTLELSKGIKLEGTTDRGMASLQRLRLTLMHSHGYSLRIDMPLKSIAPNLKVFEIFGDAICEDILTSLWAEVPDTLEEVKLDVGAISAAAQDPSLASAAPSTNGSPARSVVSVASAAPSVAAGRAAFTATVAAFKLAARGIREVARDAKDAISVPPSARPSMSGAPTGRNYQQHHQLGLETPKASFRGQYPGDFYPTVPSTPMTPMIPRPMDFSHLAPPAPVLKLLPKVRRLMLFQLYGQRWLKYSGLNGMAGLREIEIAGAKSAKPDEVLETMALQLGDSGLQSVLFTGFRFIDIRGITALMHIPKLQRVRLNGVRVTKPDCFGALRALAWHRYVQEVVLYGATKEEAEAVKAIRTMMAAHKPKLAMFAEVQ